MKKALFLDRDGIINKDYGYVYQIDKFEFNDGIFDVIKWYQKRGYLIVIITNQSGIGRGYYSKDDFFKLSRYMLDEFQKRDLRVNSIYYCPHAPEVNCQCRKPNTKMLISAKDDFNIDLENSIIVGDKQSDINLGINAKVNTTIAIGNRDIKNSTYSFKTISQFRDFLYKQS